MSKLEILLISLFTAFIMNIPSTIAQIPLNDVSWITQDAAHGTEEFNTALDFTNKWYNQRPWGAEGGGAELSLPANLIETGTTLQIKADNLSPDTTLTSSLYSGLASGAITFVYQAGTLWRKQVSSVELYKFGYIEIYAKYPTSYYSLWPAFWLYTQGCDGGVPYYEEIDITENYPQITYSGQTIGTNIHMNDAVDCSYTDMNHNGQDISTGFTLSGGFHKYACEWAPDRIIWYLDDIAIRTLYDPTETLVPQHAMTTILSFGIGAEFATLPSNWDLINETPTGPTSYPQYFEIDYLRYYKLDIDCSTNLTNLCTPAGYDRKVKKSITTDNTCTPTFNHSGASSSYTLRATDYVTLNVGVEINPSGTGYFAIQTMSCPD